MFANQLQYGRTNRKPSRAPNLIIRTIRRSSCHSPHFTYVRLSPSQAGASSQGHSQSVDELARKPVLSPRASPPCHKRLDRKTWHLFLSNSISTFSQSTMEGAEPRPWPHASPHGAPSWMGCPCCPHTPQLHQAFLSLAVKTLTQCSVGTGGEDRGRKETLTSRPLSVRHSIPSLT